MINTGLSLTVMMKRSLSLELCFLSLSPLLLLAIDHFASFPSCALYENSLDVKGLPCNYLVPLMASEAGATVPYLYLKPWA